MTVKLTARSVDLSQNIDFANQDLVEVECVEKHVEERVEKVALGVLGILKY